MDLHFDPQDDTAGRCAFNPLPLRCRLLAHRRREPQGLAEMERALFIGMVSIAMPGGVIIGGTGPLVLLFKLLAR